MKLLDKYITRDKSCLTGSSNFKTLHEINNFPVFFGVTDTPLEEDLYAKMSWKIEESTGLIQLNELIPLDILYQSQHAYGFGPTWENHYQQFSTFLLKRNIQDVLEIGAGQGRIAEICTINDSIKSWTVIEPNPTLGETNKIKIHRGFFDKNVKLEQKFDTYTFSHVLEHAYNPFEFLDNIYSHMGLNDKLIFSYPNLSNWLENKFTNSLNFEHTIFLNDSHLDTMLNNVGFKIVAKEEYLGHSYFYHVEKLKNKVVVPYENCYETNRELLVNFIKYHVDEVRHLNNIILTSSNPIFLFGAHIFSQYLTVFGLHTNKIIGILDNSIQKQGKRLYGTDLEVFSPLRLNEYESPICILRAGPYNQEIKSQILNEINTNTTFV